MSDDRPAVMAADHKAAKTEVPTADHGLTSGEPRPALSAALRAAPALREAVVDLVAELVEKAVAPMRERVATLEAFLGLEPGAGLDPVAAAALRFRVDAREKTAQLRQEGKG